MGNERSQSQKNTCYMIPSVGSVQKRQIHRGQRRSVPAREWVEKAKVCFRSDESVLKSILVKDAPLCEYTKSQYIYNLGE